jgi:ankyrin repeat protein
MVMCAQLALQLIEMGADSNVKSLDGSTPLMDAARNDHSETVTGLVTIIGCDVSAREAGGRTALHFAALNGHEQTAKALVELGAGKKDFHVLWGKYNFVLCTS